MPDNKKAIELLNYAHNSYANQRRNTTYNLLVYGRMGTGKTRLIKTARKPILIHSFDPGGSKTLLDDIDGTTIITDTRFEEENASTPNAWALFDKTFHMLKRAQAFDSIGTYCIDSLTTLASCVMNYVLKQDNRAGGVPFQQDWLPQMTYLENVIKELVALPCDCILTAHPDVIKDDVTGKTFSTPMVTGKLKARLPLLFDEIYYADAAEKADGTNWFLVTRKTKMIDARTRLGREGKFDLYEKPDIKYLMKKAGVYTDDLPPIPQLKGGEMDK